MADKNNKYFNRFSTSPISGDKVIIEYYKPSYVSEKANLNISNIIHGYKDIFSNEGRGYNDSQACNNNVNCPEAQPWNDEISSVVMALTDGGTRLCSGALINNANQDFEMYFLTSETCLGGHEDWVFMFNYESPSCDNEDGPTDQTLSGATLLTHHHESDYALLRIEETPPEYFDVYFSGWDRRNIAPQNCISIHHPVGDIKKICSLSMRICSPYFRKLAKSRLAACLLGVAMAFSIISSALVALYLQIIKLISQEY